jgi:1-acyl-sn-glycerol-3-phosphate acyltransferase
VPVAPTRAYRLAAVARPAVALLFRPSVRGLEHVPGGGGGFVLSSNQLSNLDGFALAFPLFPRQVRWMGKAELFRGPPAPVLRRLGIFPVRRGAGDLEAVRTATELVRGGTRSGSSPRARAARRASGRRRSRARTRAPRAWRSRLACRSSPRRWWGRSG